MTKVGIRDKEYGATTGGIATAYTLSIPLFGALEDVKSFNVKFHTTNGLNATLDINGLGAKPLVDQTNTAITAAFLDTNGVYIFAYNLANDKFVFMNAGATGGSDAFTVKGSVGDATPGFLDAKVKNSVEVNANQLQLVGDSAAPGNNKIYGTNGVGTKGYNSPATLTGDTRSNIRLFTQTGGGFTANVDDDVMVIDLNGMGITYSSASFAAWKVLGKKITIQTLNTGFFDMNMTGLGDNTAINSMRLKDSTCATIMYYGVGGIEWLLLDFYTTKTVLLGVLAEIT